VWASDQAGSQLVAVDQNTGRVRTIQLTAGSFPYTITIAPDGNSLWFTEVFAFKLARLDNQFNLHEYEIPEVGTPAQIVFANSSLGYYVDTGNVGLVEPGIYSFNPNNFSPTLIDPSTNRLILPTSLALTNNGIWVTQHATSELAYYRFGSHEVIQFPTTPVSYVKTTLPYFVAGNGSLVWFNEHYANRIGVIDTAHGLLTEYSLSDPPANKTSQIDNALTFALGGSRVWFTELTGNYVGYVDATYKSTFSFQPISQNMELASSSTATTTLTLQGTSDSNLTLIPSYARTLIPKPSTISLTLGSREIGTMQGPVTTTLTVTLSADMIPGRYELLVTATNGLLCQGAYLTLVVVQ
jgi:streptogramin lyase